MEEHHIALYRVGSALKIVASLDSVIPIFHPNPLDYLNKSNPNYALLTIP